MGVIRSRLCTGLLVVLLAPVSLLYGAWQEPLDEDEIISATALAVIDPLRTRQSSSATPLATDDPHLVTQAGSIGAQGKVHPLGKQVLLVELREQKNPTDRVGRVAEIFVFDYLRGVAELNWVDVEQSLLIRKQELESVHLPLSAAEIRYTKTLLWDNEEIRGRISDENLSAGAVVLDDSVALTLSDLRARVSIWVPDHPRQAGLSHCDRERCALISLFTVNNYNFSIEPVINLMNGKIYPDLVQ